MLRTGLCVCAMALGLLAGIPAALAGAGSAASRGDGPEEACARLAVDYALNWDRFDAEGVAALFTEDATLAIGGAPMTGRAAIAARVAGMAGKITIRHIVSNVRVEPVDATTAQTISYVQVVMSREPPAEGRPAPFPPGVVLAEYHDRCVKTAEGWRLAERTLKPIFVPAPPPAPAQ